MSTPRGELTAREISSRGGTNAMKKLTPEQRTAKARDAARARWARYRQQRLGEETSAA